MGGDEDDGEGGDAKRNLFRRGDEASAGSAFWLPSLCVSGMAASASRKPASSPPKDEVPDFWLNDAAGGDESGRARVFIAVGE